MRTLLVMVGLLFSQVAAAQESLSYLDLYYSRSELSVDGLSGSAKGPGAGVRAWIGRSWPIVTLEYQETRPEGTIAGMPVDGEANNFRAGLGLRLIQTPRLSAWVRAEYVEIEVIAAPLVGASFDDRGAGAHLGARIGADRFFASAEGGVLRADDFDATEVRVTGSYELPSYGLFIEFRRSDLELDNGSDAVLEDLRGGIRWLF